MSVSPEWLEFLRQQFPVGSRINVKHTAAEHPELENCRTGVLRAINDDAEFFVTLDNGKTVELDVGFDRFSVSEPEPHTMKLYMPLTADLYGRNEWGDMEEEATELDGRGLTNYEDKIIAALLNNRMDEEAERGIMTWYHEDDGVDQKVRSAVFNAEERNGILWGVVECRVIGELEPQELETLKEYVSGQASDGWGEGFEQREIDIGGGSELYVHLWSYGNDWSIRTEEECFGPKYAEGLPDLCWSVLPDTGDLICIKRGESGYFHSDWNTGDRQRNREIADSANEQRGITKAQEQAMVVGSMCGWHVPGADPKCYEEYQPEMGGMTLA